jgi:hypothetical protein
MPKEKKETKQDQSKYVEKVEKIEKETEIVKNPQRDEPKPQTNAVPFDPERREDPVPTTRKVRVMGRSRNDKTIKTISCNFVETPSIE